MLNLLLFILCGIGITNVLVNASILESFREWLEVNLPTFGALFRCMLCTGFWVGALCGPLFTFNPILGAAIISLGGDLYSSATEALDSWSLSNSVELLEDE